MDAIDTFKLQALDTMKQTVDRWSTEVDKAQPYLDRVHAADAPKRGRRPTAAPTLADTRRPE